MSEDLDPNFFKRIAGHYATWKKLPDSQRKLILKFAEYIDKALNETEKKQNEKN